MDAAPQQLNSLRTCCAYDNIIVTVMHVDSFDCLLPASVCQMLNEIYMQESALHNQNIMSRVDAFAYMHGGVGCYGYMCNNVRNYMCMYSTCNFIINKLL